MPKSLGRDEADESEEVEEAKTAETVSERLEEIPDELEDTGEEDAKATSDGCQVGVERSEETTEKAGDNCEGDNGGGSARNKYRRDMSRVQTHEECCRGSRGGAREPRRPRQQDRQLRTPRQLRSA